MFEDVIKHLQSEVEMVYKAKKAEYEQAIVVLSSYRTPAEQTGNSQSTEIADLRKRIQNLEKVLHDFAMLHSPLEGFDYSRI